MFGVPIRDIDAEFLRLDTANDPLTGTLSAQALQPTANQAYELGTTALRYGRLHSTAPYFNFVDIPTGLTIDDTPAAGSAPSHQFFCQNGPAFTGGVQTLSVNKTGNDNGISFNGMQFTGSSKGTVNTTVAMNGPGSFNWVHQYNVGFPSGTQIVTQNGWGSAMIGLIGSNAQNNATLTMQSGAGGFGIGGCFTGGWLSTFQTSAIVGRIQTFNSGFLAGGQFAHGYADGGFIESNNSGAFAQGYAQQNGAIRASGAGAFAQGFAFQGQITALSSGAMAVGFTDDPASAISAAGTGAKAGGGAVLGGVIGALANGAFAHGFTSGGVSILATALNAGQFFPGTNAEPDTLAVGTTMRLKGSLGAPSVPRDGDIWVTGVQQTFRTAGVNVTIRSANPGYTITNVTPDRAYDANATTTAELADTLGTLIADMQAMNLIP